MVPPESRVSLSSERNHGGGRYSGPYVRGVTTLSADWLRSEVGELCDRSGYVRSMTRKSITPDSLSRLRDDWRMSPGVSSNGLLFLTGMTGSRFDGTCAADPEQQIRDAFAKVAIVLAEAELDCSHIVEMTSYHVGLDDHLDLFRSIRDEHVAEPYPAWTAIEVAGFIPADAIVELRVVADSSGTA